MANVLALPLPSALILDARKVAFLQRLQSGDPARFYLGGIHVQPWGAGVRLTATDGNRLGIMLDSTGPACAWSAILEFPKIPARFTKRDGVSLEVAVDGLVTLQGELLGRVAVIDGTFPAVDRVFPDMSAPVPVGPQISYNALLFGAFAWGPDASAITLDRPPNQGGAAVVRNMCPDFIGLLMPMARAEGALEIARFTSPPAEAEAEAA